LRPDADQWQRVAIAPGVACGLGIWNVAAVGTVIAVALLTAARVAELIGVKKPG
jgi:uncharacterized membrane protein YhiD involved in acid resistance